MAGIVINADAATRLMAELQAKHVVLVASVKRETLAAGLRMQATARELARSKSMPSLRRSIATRTKQFVTGIEVTVEAKSPFGYIREFGAGRSGPHPYMGPSADMHIPVWESKLLDAADLSA